MILDSNIKLLDVLFVPQFSCNLISIYELTSDMNCTVTYASNNCVIQDLTGRRTIGSGELCDGVYVFRTVREVVSLAAYSQDKSVLWHARIGHPSNQNLFKLSSFIKFSFDASKLECCDICHRSKQCMIPFPLSSNKASKAFELIHCDLWGKYNTKSHNGSHYFLTIVDDYTRAVWVYLLKEKSETASHLINFCKMVKTQFEAKVKIMRSDNGTEFVNSQVQNFLHDEGILRETSCVSTPQQNGRVERKHRHILNVARALRFQANLPLTFWGECVLTAVHLINRTPTVANKGVTPYEMLYGKSPSYEHLRVFGCLYYMKTATKPNDKFAARATRCIFVGYPWGQKGWRVYNPSTREFSVSRDVKFYEHIFPYIQHEENRPSIVFPNVISTQEDVFQECSNDDDDAPINTESEPRTSAHDFSPDNFNHEGEEEQASGETESEFLGPRIRQPPKYLKDYYCHAAVQDPPHSTLDPAPSPGKPYPMSQYVSYNNFSISHKAFLSAILSHDEPKNYSQAVQHPQWRDAMAREIKALEDNNTWTLEPLPEGKKLVGSRWVYKIKYKANGEIDKYKARLVAKGYTQVEGEDFTETFAPVAKMTTIRCLLSIAAVKNWELHQMDVSNAFLHGDLNEEVYMAVPPGYVVTNPRLVCRLRKSLYGLRQASRNWYAKLSQALIHYGFQQCSADHSLFTYSLGSNFLAILVYVDDLIIAGNDTSACNNFKDYLSKCFHMKDLGKLKYFLGLELSYGNTGLFLCQHKYTMDILKECGMLDCKPCGFPMEQNHGLSADIGEVYSNPSQYRRLVGRLIYLTITRPEITYSIHILSQFMQEPRQTHWDAAMRVLRYLKSSPGQGLLLSRNSNLQLTGYCDSDYATCPTTRRSISGYLMQLGTSSISWKTKKQTTVSRSSSEAEYRAMSHAASEIVWLRNLLSTLQVPCDAPTPLLCDNQSALHIAANPVFHERTKHIEVDCHFVREHIQAGRIATNYLSTKQQLADMFTKALGHKQFHYLLSKLGVHNLHSPT